MFRKIELFPPCYNEYGDIPKMELITEQQNKNLRTIEVEFDKENYQEELERYEKEKKAVNDAFKKVDIDKMLNIIEDAVNKYTDILNYRYNVALACSFDVDVDDITQSEIDNLNLEIEERKKMKALVTGTNFLTFEKVENPVKLFLENRVPKYKLLIQKAMYLRKKRENDAFIKLLHDQVALFKNPYDIIDGFRYSKPEEIVLPDIDKGNSEIISYQIKRIERDLAEREKRLSQQTFEFEYNKKSDINELELLTNKHNDLISKFDKIEHDFNLLALSSLFEDIDECYYLEKKIYRLESKKKQIDTIFSDIQTIVNRKQNSVFKRKNKVNYLNERIKSKKERLEGKHKELNGMKEENRKTEIEISMKSKEIDFILARINFVKYMIEQELEVTKSLTTDFLFDQFI